MRFYPEVKGHMGQGQIRVPNKGRWAHDNVKLLHFKHKHVVNDNYEKPDWSSCKTLFFISKLITNCILWSFLSQSRQRHNWEYLNYPSSISQSARQSHSVSAGKWDIELKLCAWCKTTSLRLGSPELHIHWLILLYF